MNAPLRDTWTEANQRLLGAEFARIGQRLGGPGEAASHRAAAQAAREAMPLPSAIDQLAGAFGLSTFERDLLLLCAGVEMDAHLAALCEAAAGGSRDHAPSFGFALASLDAPHWSALAPDGPLRRWRLLEVDDATGLTRGRLRIDERVLHGLAGVNSLDTRLRSLMRPLSPAPMMADSQRAIADAVALALDAAPAGETPLVWLTGDDAAGQADVAAQAGVLLGLALHRVSVQDLPASAAELDALATLWEREVLLLGGALLLRCGAEPLPPTALRFVEGLRGPVFVSGGQPQAVERACVRFTVDKPPPLEQKRLWQQALVGAAERLDGTLDGIAAQFRLSARQIDAEGAQLAAALGADTADEGAVWSACRALCRSRLDDLAQRLEPVADWADLVLPAAQLATLRELVEQVRNRLKVYLEWGFAAQGARGLGIGALFAGESGTGKTMAAEVLARELRLDLYRIDLSAVVSKYIGETEKNLRRVFDAAEDSGAILLFDEADALFGKRSEVKDSHDRYANIEVSYLLQRMEAYRGLAILTTNLKGALDGAFQRRLRFVVQFPFPDQALREAIWRQALPARTPQAAIDHARLARLSVAGGSIRNIALGAAFRAAALGEPVSMAHLLHAAHQDAGKRERPLNDAETRGWA